MTRVLALFVAMMSVSALTAPMAMGEGADNVGGAPIVAYGQRETGTTATGLDVNGVYSSFWKLKVRAGDTVTIDWEAGPKTLIAVDPVGTNEYNFVHTFPSRRAGIGPTGRNQLKFVAPRSGMMPLAFESNSEYLTAYYFTARVRHHRAAK